MKPPFTLTNIMLNKVVEISKIIGKLEFQVERNLKLRKQNRIQSIHSSLAIENNSLSVEQITAIINGKRVLGNPKEIQEVKNAYDAYEEILKLNPYSQKDFLYAHSLLTHKIINTPGSYRQSDVGIFDQSGNLVHMGARPQFILPLMDDLFQWGDNDDTLEIIKSCVFHYEIETIHPFEDGNGRMGRLWQTVILANWHQLFAWLPIETMIHENQAEYYRVLALADSANDSSVFIDFMLDIILKTLESYQTSEEVSKLSDYSLVVNELSAIEKQVFQIIKAYLLEHESITTAIASEAIGKAESSTRKYFATFVKLGLLETKGTNRNRSYSLKH